MGSCFIKLGVFPKKVTDSILKLDNCYSKFMFSFLSLLVDIYFFLKWYTLNLCSFSVSYFIDPHLKHRHCAICHAN